ncbi:hypothetical protein B0H13DRAFT_2337373 [Mycena leptocephala]|nr:hypothetical protein B0H13DRAFT_2337373 [Mycena leptocephala]
MSLSGSQICFPVHRTGSSKSGSLIPRLAYEEHVTLPIQDAIQPIFPCTMCLLFNVKCISHSVGVECANCIKKKVGGLCDHISNTPRLQEIIANFKTIENIMDLNGGPIDVQQLRKLANRAIMSQTIALGAREDFSEQLRKFLVAAYKQNLVLGTEGFQSLFTEKVRPVIRKLFNQMIFDYNCILDPTIAEAPDSDAEPSPESEDNEDDINSVNEVAQAIPSSPAAKSDQEDHGDDGGR